jgi:hypothetical protein
MAFSAATLDLQPFASSRVLHSVSRIILDPSTGAALISALTAEVTAVLTGWPLSMASDNSAGRRGRNAASIPAPRDLHIRSTRTGADSRSYPDFEPDQISTTSMILAS